MSTSRDSSLPDASRPRLTPAWIAVLAGSLLALAGVAALPIDLPVARWFMEQRCHPFFVKLVSLAEVMSHGIGAATLLVTIAVLDPTRLRRLARLATMSLGAGVLANCMKLFLARRRPYHFDFQGGPLATFGEWFPGTGAGSGAQSFLSSHAAVAMGMALGLMWLYPRGRWLFAMYGALAMTQRLVAGAHYTSDVLWGASLGMFWAAVCLSPRMAGGWFDAFESRASRRSSSSPAVARTAATDRPAPPSFVGWVSKPVRPRVAVEKIDHAE